MLERRSALAAAKPFTSSRLEISESRSFSLIQASGLSADFEKKMKFVLGTLPKTVGTAKQQAGRGILRIGPTQFWILGPEDDGVANELAAVCAITPLSHSRTRIVLDGAPAREVLSKLVPLDFRPRVFPSGSFAMTGLHHTPVLIYCTGKDHFHVFALRTFATSVWEVITDAALQYSDRN